MSLDKNEKSWYTIRVRGEKIMKTKYITIDLRTIKGFEKAERLQQQGWKIINVGWDDIQMFKEKDKK